MAIVRFCVPGNNFTGKWVDALLRFFNEAVSDGRYRFKYTRAEDCNIYNVRNSSLCGKVELGPDQAPFGGEEYDYILMVDSDVLVDFRGFLSLISHDEPIVSGWYVATGGERVCVGKKIEERPVRITTEQLYTVEEVEGRKSLFEAGFVGLGFALIKKGVFENIGYPWFRPLYGSIDGTIGFTTDDVGFCVLAKSIGYNIMVDPKVRVGHEKRGVL